MAQTMLLHSTPALAPQPTPNQLLQQQNTAAGAIVSTESSTCSICEKSIPRGVKGLLMHIRGCPHRAQVQELFNCGCNVCLSTTGSSWINSVLSCPSIARLHDWAGFDVPYLRQLLALADHEIQQLAENERRLRPAKPVRASSATSTTTSSVGSATTTATTPSDVADQPVPEQRSRASSYPFTYSPAVVAQAEALYCPSGLPPPPANRIQYSRDFLLAFKDVCTKPPPPVLSKVLPPAFLRDAPPGAAKMLPSHPRTTRLERSGSGGSANSSGRPSTTNSSTLTTNSMRPRVKSFDHPSRLGTNPASFTTERAQRQHQQQQHRQHQPQRVSAVAAFNNGCGPQPQSQTLFSSPAAIPCGAGVSGGPRMSPPVFVAKSAPSMRSSPLDTFVGQSNVNALLPQ